MQGEGHMSFSKHPRRSETVARDDGAEKGSKKTAAQRLSATIDSLAILP